jgi:hypothetical protein
MTAVRSAPTWPAALMSFWRLSCRATTAGCMPMAWTTSALRSAVAANTELAIWSADTPVRAMRENTSLATAKASRTMAEPSAMKPRTGCSRKMTMMNSGAHGASKNGSSEDPPTKLRTVFRSCMVAPRLGPRVRAAASEASSRSGRAVSSHQRPSLATATPRRPSKMPSTTMHRPGHHRQIDQRLDPECQQHPVEHLEHVDRRHQDQKVDPAAQQRDQRHAEPCLAKHRLAGAARRHCSAAHYDGPWSARRQAGHCAFPHPTTAHRLSLS